MSQAFKLSSVLASLSHALDLTEGQPAGHSIRACLIGMEIGQELGLSAKDLSDLYYALLLKDAGCSVNAAPVADLFGSDDHAVKRKMKVTDWSRLVSGAWYMIRSAGLGGSLTRKLIHLVGIARGGGKAARELTRVRCERGAKIAGGLGFAAPTCEAIRHLDEHWDGAGHPYGVNGEQIPLLARICSIAQTVEVFLAQSGKDGALGVVRERRKKWFGPDVSDVVLGWADRDGWWEDVRAATDTEALAGLEPPDHVRRVTLEQLDRVAESFAGIIDAKSPFTFEHSARVAKIARELGTRLGVSDEDKRVLYQGGLLHDVGKLGISNRILDKPGSLTPQEFEQIVLHPLHSWEILSHVDAFSHLAAAASRHHERLDGNGYPWGLGEADLDLATRIITVADVFEAITANRPYRKPMSTKQVLQVLEGGAGSALDPDVVTTMTGLMDEHRNDSGLGLATGS